MDGLIFIGAFILVCVLFALIDWLHERWAWRTSIRETNEQMRAEGSLYRLRDAARRPHMPPRPIPPPSRIVREDRAVPKPKYINDGERK